MLMLFKGNRSLRAFNQNYRELGAGETFALGEHRLTGSAGGRHRHSLRL